MFIKTISIKNFRWIKEIKDFELNNLSILVWNNWTSKTSILEAINFVLSPHFLSWRIKYTDFYNGWDDNIEIKIIFDWIFKSKLPDWYYKQEIDCNWIFLEIKKRDRQTPNKAFSEIVTVNHYVLPNREKDNSSWWEIKRKWWTNFKFDERLLSFPVETVWLPKSFYFWKNREKQLQKWFNSSIWTILEDFNWRFNKEIRKEINWFKTFSSDTYIYEENLLSKVDEQTHRKTFTTLNSKLEKFNLPEVDLSIINRLEPFDNALLTWKLDEINLPISNLWSWIEMIVAILFLETISSLSKENFILIIDEPELHLHPKFQNTLIDHLKILSKENQILLSTHSPYIFKNCSPNEEIELLLTIKNEENNLILKNTWDDYWLFPWSPSWWEINYYAYNLPTIEFHNELYWFIQEKAILDDEKNYFENYFDDYLLIKLWKKELDKIKYIRLKKDLTTEDQQRTIQTYIRNKIHHPENTNNKDYTEEELKTSIQEMIEILNNYN